MTCCKRSLSGKQLSNPTTAALRLFFHDCFVNGCDASLLIASSPFNKSELDADSNMLVAGIVSCADILAVSARDLVVMVGDPAMSAFNDVYTPGKFDNMYYKNLQRGLGLLSSDQAMVTDPRTKPFVDRYAANQKAFFDMFAHSMLKLSVYKVQENINGDVRRRCDQFNTVQI
ncbi:Peroxidase 6 [Hibiscus syriacus]|uniref:peroxidase n=1 Tax=Hibiscus syriacus TaxID=106335 RepID=A0A6A2ZFK8_HIBSY|nr:Peroxidase 6 [Hibiscus syriacus]